MSEDIMRGEFRVKCRFCVICPTFEPSECAVTPEEQPVEQTKTGWK